MAPEDSYLGSARTTLREPYPDEPCGVGQVRDLSVIYGRLQSVREYLSKITSRAEDDAGRISGPIPCAITGGGDVLRDEPSSDIGRINVELDNINRWISRLDDATGRFSNL